MQQQEAWSFHPYYILVVAKIVQHVFQRLINIFNFLSLQFFKINLTFVNYLWNLNHLSTILLLTIALIFYFFFILYTQKGKCRVFQIIRSVLYLDLC